MKKNISKDVEESKFKTFRNKMKSDQKYSAKVQLMGYGILILLLVVYLNISSMGSGNLGSNNIINNIGDGNLSENTDKESTSLLERVANNYSYEMEIELKTKVVDENTKEEKEEEKVIRYVGKSYGNKLEINKEVNGIKNLYYKVDDNYYSKKDDEVSYVKSKEVYDLVDVEYIELVDIIKLLNKASLDHVTDYSSGKKEYVYHLYVRDVIVSYKLEDMVEINIVEENGVLDIDIDYSSLFKVMDNNILECELEATITQIGEVEEFEVVVAKEENTSKE